MDCFTLDGLHETTVGRSLTRADGSWELAQCHVSPAAFVVVACGHAAPLVSLKAARHIVRRTLLIVIADAGGSGWEFAHVLVLCSL